MADSNQGASPRQAAFDRIASIYGDNAPAKIDPKSAYDDIARKTRVPANVLMALDEAAGGEFDPARAEANATRLAAAVAENKPMDSAIAELVGDPDRASSLMDRAYDIADELYPAPAAPPGKGNDGKVSAAEAIGGTARSALGGAISGIGGAIEAGGVAVDEALRFGADPATDRPTIARGLGRGIGEAVKGGADALTGLSTDDFQEKVAGTAPGGNLLDPSSWTLGDDPSITGLINVAAQGLGSMIPIVAAPGPRAAAVFGSLMGGGEGVENGRKFVEDAATTLDDAGQPEIAKLPEYKSMVRAGRSHEDTVAELARQAENNAGFRQGIVAGLGGAATNRIMSKAEGWLGEGGRLTRAVKKGVAGAGEEGLQEAAEGIAAGTGIQKATGADLDLMQDSFGDFVGGALAGGAMGGIAGAAMRGDSPEAAAPGPMDPARGLPAPRPALPGPTGAAPAAGPDAGPTRGLPAILTGQAPAEQAAPDPAAPISGPDAAIPLPTPTPMAPISAAGAGMEPAAAPLPPLPPEGAAVPVQPEVPMPPAPAPVAPAGPIEDISTTLAANLPVPEPELPQRFPDMKPGKTIDLGLPEGQNVTAVAVREEADGVVVRVNGAEQLLTPEQFDSARDQAKKNELAAKEATKAGTAAQEAKPAGSYTDKTAREIESGMAAMAEGAKQAARKRVRDMIGRGEDVTYRNPEAVKLAKGDADLNVRDNADGSVTVLGVKDDTGAWVGADPAQGGKGLTLYHGSPRADLTVDGIEIVRADGQKQGKKGRVYGGFYAADESRVSDAEGYAGETGTVYEIELKPDAVVEQKEGDITRLSETAISEYVARGVDVVVGKDPRGRTEYAILNKAAINRFEDRNQKKGQTSASVQPSPAQDAAPEPARPGAMRDGADDAGVGGVPLTGENDLALGENPDAGLAGRPDIERSDAGQPAVGGVDAAPGADQLGAALTADPADKVGAALRIGISGGPQEYMTSKGKLKIGYTLTGVTKAEANKIDPYSIRTPTGAFVNKDRADAFVAQQGEAIKDTAPVAAAAADVAPAPTDAQKEAGNYKKGHARWNGLDLSIETARGQDRTGTDPNGREWSVKMPADYGYIRGTKGADGDHIDFYMGPNEASDYVLVIDQKDIQTGAFDEHKVILGAEDAAEAMAIYRAGFSDGKGGDRIGGITEMHGQQFRGWLDVGDHKKPASPRFDGPARPMEQTAAQKAREEADAAPVEAGPRLKTRDEGMAAGRAWAKAGGAETESDPAMGNASDAAKGGWTRGYREEKGVIPPKGAAPVSTAPEHAAVGVDSRELSEIVAEFNDAEKSMQDGGDKIHHLFDRPAKDDIVRLGKKAGVRQATKEGKRVYHRDAGWLTPAEARERIESWKAHAAAQGGPGSANAQKVVLSLFDYTGAWSQPWEDAGYQVFRFDIQSDPDVGDVNKFSTEFFSDWFGDFDGMDIHAILAACPCTDFASSGSRHFAAKDADGRTVASVKLVHQTLATIEHFRPAVWAVENPVGRIENLGGLPPWRLSFDPFHLGDTYTKNTLLWGRFNGDLPIAPVEPTEGSKMHSQYGGKSLATKNARSATPEGFAYGFFMANNAIDHPVLALHGKFDRLDRDLIERALDMGITPEAITDAVDDFYYMELDDDAANQAIRDLIDPPAEPDAEPIEDAEIVEESAPAPADVAQPEAQQAQAETAPVEDAAPEQPEVSQPAPGILGVLSQAKQDRVAELKAKLAAKARSQASSGIDPEYITLGGELVGLYIEAGVTRFGQMLRDFAATTGLSMKEAVVPMRAAYDYVRDDMEDNGEDISQFDGPEAVRAEGRKAVKAETEAAAADTNPAPGQIAAKTIRADVAVTARGREIPVRYALVEIDSLIPSQTDEGRANPAYDKKLQPRDRSGNKSAEQVRTIAQNLNPALLGESPMASTGAPIILPTGEVLSGNGRTLSLRQVYADNRTAQAKAYRQFLRDGGYWDGSEMRAPVLVRIADGMSMEDAAAFAREANERDTADMSVSEQAMVDAENLSPAILSLYRGGDVDAVANADFVRAFGKDVMAANDAGRMRDNEGRMTQDAVRRINGALLAKAYGDAGIVAAVLESTDSGIKSIGGALTDVAPVWAQMRAAVEQGTIAPDADITADLVEAVKLVERARREARPLSDFLNQTDMFSGDSVSPGAVKVLGILYRDTGTQPFRRPYGRDKMADALSFYAGEALKTTPGVDLLGESADAGAILSTAKGRINDQQDGTQDLFGQRPASSGDAASAGAAGNEPAVQDGQAGVRGSSGSRDGSQGGLSDDAGSNDTGIRQGGVAGAESQAADGSGLEAGDGPGGEVGGTGVSDQDGATDQLAAGLVADSAGSAGDAAGQRKGVSPGNFVIDASFPLGEGTPGQKIDANIAAIKLALALTAENRYPTRAEQEVLARYVGWGGLKRVFDPRETGNTTQFGRAQAELKAILTPQQYRAAGRSTADAHYTSRTVVSAMWEKMRAFGFDGGRVLEPTIGAGNFVGLQPADLSERSEWFASELDKVTGLIAKHLYPDATIFDGMGFERAPFRPGSIDVAIGNPPFGNDPITSKLHPEIPPLSVHNYMIAKTGLLLRPGGIMGMVITSNFLDAPNPQARTYLARHFNFLGAVRLPNTAFKANAGTEVTTDIVWFQKRNEGEPAGDLSWLENRVKLGNVEVNGYFAANPQMMLGTPGMDGKMRGAERGDQFTLHDDGRDLSAALTEALGSIEGSLNERTQALEAAVVADKPTSAMAIGEMQMLADGRVMIRRDDDAEGAPTIEEVTADTAWGTLAAERVAVADAATAARDAIKNGTPEEQTTAIEAFKVAAAEAGVFKADGGRKPKPTKIEDAIYRLSDGLMDANPFFGKAQTGALSDLRGLVDGQKLGAKKLTAMKQLLGLRRDAQALLRAEHDNNPAMEKMRKALAEDYRAFVKAHGFIGSRANDALIGGVPGIEAALETGYKPADTKRGTKEKAKEAAILRKRIITPYAQIRSARTPADGVHISLRERGRLDLGFIASLTGSNIEAVTEALTQGENPQAFFDPTRDEYVIADEYLSGNLAEKIEAARKDGRFDNVRALEAAMPAPKTAQQITPSIRSMWLPADVFEGFLKELGARKPKVSINRTVGMIETEAGIGAVANDFGKTFATERVSAFTVFANAVKGKAITVYDVEQGGKRVKNETETTNANAAIDRMSAEFQKWAYVNADRQKAIVDAFNTTMNVIVPRKFDGVRYLTQVGANPEIQMRNSQKNGAWRQMLSKSTLLHHVVGAGKTFTAITAIMEGKRLGLYRKPMVAVPNHLVSQWARDFYALYPGANILAATEKDFSAKNRRKLIARMATGDYDAIIIGHSQVAYIDNDPAKAAALIEEQVSDLQESMEEAKRSGQNRGTVGQMQKRISKLEDRLKALAEEAEKGEKLGFTFLETGIDNLIVDEAQEFKNLQYSTAADRLVGMNSPDGSQKALDLYTKTRSLLDGDGSVAFLTGTPVSNSLVEIYTVMKYLAPGTLREMGLMHYDSWASSFVQSKTRFEYTAAQKLKERNVLAGLVNLGPLSELYKTFADIVMRPDVERMYREQMEAQNERDGTNLPTRFPTPKVRGGGRQLVTIPASDLHKEFTDYLVLRMEGIKRNAGDKDYMKKDNALWVLSDARKASIDIRTVDPTAHRVLESKVVRSGDKIMQIAKATDSVKGTQMVFADSSVPLKNAGKDIEKALKAAWEKAGLSKGEITSRMERDKRQGKTYSQQWGETVEAMENRMASGDMTPAQMDALEEWMNGDVAGEGAGNALTADTGFSFYDDLKAYLVEQGMDPEQIAFIHDYSTAAQKSALFEAVNSGDVRVLIGSTFKMGAGTNAQQRLVALHHIDAPWRPSDMEQREGRIIRQGNDLYMASIGALDETQPGLRESVAAIFGDEFAVDILAYTTEQTSDVVMWQVLERKANGIEQFLNATADTLIEEDGDADSYAEFMAQSTGNPVFMQKMQAEKDVRDMEAALSSLQMISNDAQRRIEGAPERIKRNEDRLAALETLSFDAFPDAGATFEAYQKAQATYEAARLANKEEEAAVRERNEKLAEGEKKEKLPKFDMTPPVMFDGDLDPYMAAIRDAIMRAQRDGSSDMSGGSPIRLGPDLELRIEAAKGFGIKDADEGVNRYTANIVSKKLAGGALGIELIEGFGAVAKNPLASRTLVFALMPDAIRDRLARAERNARTDIRIVNEDLPKAQEAAAKAPDRRPLEKKKRELRMLEGRARVAEVAAARARVGKSNRFADMDIKDRDLVSDKSDDAPLTPASGGLFRFTQGDTTLVAGFGAKAPGRWLDDADGQRHDQYWFESVADDGDLVMVLAARINTKDADAPTIKVIDTFPTGITGVTPATKESRFTSPGEGRVRKSDKITPDDARRINVAARAELDKVGISNRIRAVAGGNGTAAGTYQRGIIRIIRGADGNWRHTLDHEIIHALRDPEIWGGEAGLFTRDEWRALVRAARADDAVRTRVEKAYKDKTTTEQTEEMVAEFYADWARGRRDAEPGMMTAALNRIRSFFRAAAAALRGEGFQDAATIMQRIADGTVGGRGPDGPGTGQAAPLREQRNMDPIRAAMSSGRARAAGMVSREYWSKRPEVWSNLLTDAMGKDARFNILGLVPGQPLFNELGKNLMGAQSYLANKQAMDTDRNEWQAKAATTVDAWTKIGRKNPEANDRLMELMHDSTIAGIDPSKDDEWSHTNAESLKRIEAKATPTDKEAAFAERISKEIEDHQDTYDRLRRQYDALPAEFKDLYSTIRDEYSAMADATDSALLASVQIATDIAAKKARLDHAKELRRIEDDGLKGSERDAAISKADATLTAARERAGAGGKARMIQMRAAFEANRMKGPYFPLTRFGNYFVTIRDADGAVISFSRFEKKGEQAAEIERATAEGQAEGWKVSHGVLTDSADIRGAVDPVFIQEIETILAGTGASSDTMDAVWQHWLESLPDMSIRKSKIHRKGRSGFQKDAVRAFSSAMFHGAHNLARLKYGLKMDDNLNDAEAEAARQTDAERAGFVVREMRQRHAFTMKPTNNPIVTAGTSLAFVWYLGMSPASAIVNITQTTVFGIPIFATRFRDAGVTGSSAALMKAMQDFGQGRGWTEKSKNLTADEKDALRRAYERGTIDKTQAHDLAAVAESGVQYNPTREKAMRVIGFLFHHAERFNREVTFLAAYRLLRAEGKDMDASLEEADSLVKKVHFDYQNTSRPRVMQGDFAKILLTFRNFTVNALYRLFRDSHQAFAGASAEDRREARGQLVGVTLSMMAHAGIKGTWGFGLLMALLGIFTGDDQEPEEWLQDVLLMEGDDPATAAWNWTMGMALNGVPGHVAGVSLTERLGMPNLWFRPPREGTEGQDVWTHYLNEVVGPVFGLGGQWMSGLSMINDAWGEGNGENFMRGAEKMVPNFLSNGIIKPSRFGIFGANTYYGDPLMDVGALDVIKSAMGFTPAELAERYDINARLKAREKGIMGRRSDLHKKIGNALNEGRGIPADVLEDLRRFNAEYPEHPVTPDTIKASMGSRARAKARNEFGAALNPKLNDRIRGDMPPSVYN